MEPKKQLIILFSLFTILSNSNISAQDNNNMEIYYAKASKKIDASKLKTEKSTNVFVDKCDGHKYKWVKIGSQIWMAENMAYLPKVCPPKEDCGYWVYGFYRDNVGMAKANDNYKTFGVLYNYEAASKVCPSGWHLPTDEEWKILELYHGMKKKQLNKTGGRGSVARLLCSEELWPRGYKGKDKCGLKILPSGYYIYSTNMFMDAGKSCFFWSDEDAEGAVWCRRIKYDTTKIERNYQPRPDGFSVRCLKD